MSAHGKVTRQWPREKELPIFVQHNKMPTKKIKKKEGRKKDFNILQGATSDCATGNGGQKNDEVGSAHSPQ